MFSVTKVKATNYTCRVIAYRNGWAAIVAQTKMRRNLKGVIAKFLYTP